MPQGQFKSLLQNGCCNCAQSKVFSFKTVLSPPPAPQVMLDVTADHPPAFLAQTEDDGIKVENSMYYYLALKVSGQMACYISFVQLTSY